MDTDHRVTVKMVKPKTLIMQRYRQKVKQNLDQYEQSKAQDRDRKRQERAVKKEKLARNPRQLSEAREKQKLRMQAYRKSKREAEASQKESNADESVSVRSAAGKRTSSKVTERKKKHEQRKQKARKDQLVKERKKLAVLNTQKWRLRVKLNAALSQDEAHDVTPSSDTAAAVNHPADTASPSTGPVHELTSTPFSSRSTEKRALSKVRSTLPSTPMKRAYIIEKLVSSPRSSQILAKKNIILTSRNRRVLQMGTHITENIKSGIQEMKPRGTIRSAEKQAYQNLTTVAMGKVSKKYRMQSRLSKYLGVRRHLVHDNLRWKNKPRKLRKDRLSDNTKHAVQEYFLLPGVSRQIANKRDKQQKYTMSMTIRDAYDQFKSTQYHPEVKISFSAFCKLKPTCVRRVSLTNHRTCLCQICCNLSLHITAVDKFNKMHNQGDSGTLVTEKKAVADLTLCPYEGTSNPNPTCLNRTCESCGVHSLMEHFKFLTDHHSEQSVKWHKWSYITIEKDGKQKRVMSCVEQSGTIKDLLEGLCTVMVSYPGHIFRAQWQHKQMALCLDTLADSEVMMVMDYAENYSCHYQDEIQTAYFEQRQVTIHPMLAYYYKHQDEDKFLVKHSLIVISDDMTHDAFAVKVFEDEALKILASEIPDLKKVHEWTDGCAAQYKAKNSFYILSQRGTSPVITRDYFETSHGKGVCDGLGAVVKNTAHHAVLSGKMVIAGPSDLYKHCRTKLEHAGRTNKTTVGQQKSISIRQFLYIDSKDINRPEVSVLPIKGTRKIHAVRNSNMDFQSRSLSCYCEGCRSDGQCRNLAVIPENWETHMIKMKSSSEVQCTL